MFYYSIISLTDKKLVHIFQCIQDYRMCQNVCAQLFLYLIIHYNVFQFHQQIDVSIGIFKLKQILTIWHGTASTFLQIQDLQMLHIFSLKHSKQCVSCFAHTLLFRLVNQSVTCRYIGRSLAINLSFWHATD